MEHDNYKWFVNYTTNIENVSRAIRRLITSITSHNERMIDMIETTYPEVLAQIRTYNSNDQYKNIFYGGLKNATQLEAVITPYIQNKMLDVKPAYKSETHISMLEFNRIFNPKNLNIPQLLDAYLRTLHLGEQSIKEGIKNVKGKMGGKKQKRSSRNRKRKTKRRVYRSKKSHRRR
jgi:hypothetical protein